MKAFLKKHWFTKWHYLSKIVFICTFIWFGITEGFKTGMAVALFGFLTVYFVESFFRFILVEKDDLSKDHIDMGGKRSYALDLEMGVTRFHSKDEYR